MIFATVPNIDNETETAVNWQSFTVVVGGALYLVALTITFLYAISGDLVGTVISLLVAFSMSLIGFVGGLVLFFAQWPKCQWRFLIFGLISPALLWGALLLGDSFSPENQTIRDASELIRALDDFRIVKDQYPETLEALVPDYITALPKVEGAYGGFYYLTDGNTYDLGYIPTIDRYTYLLYLYTSESASWESEVLPLGDGPFDIPPTPFTTP